MNVNVPLRPYVLPLHALRPLLRVDFGIVQFLHDLAGADLSRARTGPHRHAKHTVQTARPVHQLVVQRGIVRLPIDLLGEIP